MALRMWLALPLLFSGTATAEFRCDATRKIDPEGAWTVQRLREGDWHVLIEESASGSYISRCSFSPSQQRLTCDRYEVDRVERDPNVKI